jgi:phage terminase small subunit
MANRRNWPPAEKGSAVALKHGAHAANPPPHLIAQAERVMALLQQEIWEEMRAAAPFREGGDLPAADEATMELAVRALARVRQMDEWLAGHGYVDPVTHEPRPVVAALEKATRTLDGLLDKLGMNPRSRAALGADLARARSTSPRP